MAGLIARQTRTGGITARSIRDSGITGFKLDPDVASLSVVYELFDHLPTLWQFSVPTPLSGLGNLTGNALAFRNHKCAAAHVPIASGIPFVYGTSALDVDGWRVRSPAINEGVQFLWTEGVGGNDSDTTDYLSGRNSVKIGEPLQRGLLAKLKFKLVAGFAGEASTWRFGLRAFTTVQDSLMLDTADAYDDFVAIEIGNPGAGYVFRRVENVGGAGAVYYEDANLPTPTIGDVYEFACLLVDGRVGFFLNGVEVAAPTFDFAAGLYVLPFAFFVGEAADEEVAWQKLEIYRLHHVNPGFEEAEKDLFGEPQLKCQHVDAGP